jgi:ATP-dependent Clp protease ATP-binding subunit ClpC
MSIWDAFGKGRYKGFSREAGQLLDKAVELAGGLGCKKADTGDHKSAALSEGVCCVP